jgi:hypothetical protein
MKTNIKKLSQGSHRQQQLIEAIHAAAGEIIEEGDARDAEFDAHEPVLKLEPLDYSAVRTTKPTPEEIRAFCEKGGPVDFSGCNEDDLWSAAAISPDGTKYHGAGHTPADAKALAWARSQFSRRENTGKGPELGSRRLGL